MTKAKIKLSFTPTPDTVMPTVCTKQFDSLTRSLETELCCNGQPFVVPEGGFFVLHGTRADGSVFELENMAEIDTENCVARFVFTENVLSVAGDMLCDISCYWYSEEGIKVLSTENFIIKNTSASYDIDAPSVKAELFTVPTAVKLALEEAKQSGAFNGSNGSSAYDIAVKNGFFGSEAEWLCSLKGEKGEKGENGQKGEKGEKGEAFTYNDFTAEQLDSLKGEKGEKGENGQKGNAGKSAYEQACEYGYTGSEAEFALKLASIAAVPIIGVIDDSNNIILTGALVDGSYVLKYENGGEYTEIGSFTVGKGLAPDTTLVWQLGVKIDSSTGAETQGNSSYSASNYIEIAEGYTYSLTRHASAFAHEPKIVYYDSDKSFISCSTASVCSGTGGITVVIPIISGARYFRLRNYGTATEAALNEGTFSLKAEVDS